MANISSSSIFSANFFQITTERINVTIKVDSKQLVIEGFDKKTAKIIDFLSTSFAIHWGIENSGFELCIFGCKRHEFQGTKDNIAYLRAVLSGKMPFVEWEEQYNFKSWIRNTQNCQIFQVLRGENLKVIKVIPDSDESQEVEILKLLKNHPHPSILSMDEYYQDEPNNYVVMEYCGHGSLYALHEKYSNRIPMPVIRNVMQKVLEGVNHLHQLNILHRDLKYDNILITDKEDVQIIDFGLSQQSDQVRNRAGTRGYIAPEVFSSERITSKSDIFSLGVVLHKLLTGKGVFDDMAHNQRGNFRISSHIRDDNALDLLQSMLRNDPNIRYSAEDCLAHPFFIDEHDSPASKVQLSEYLSPKFKLSLPNIQVWESVEI